MPVNKCQVNGTPGYRWGQTGKCYTYDPNDKEGAMSAFNSAARQGAVVMSKGYSLAEDVTLPKYIIRALEKGIGLHKLGLSGNGLRPATVSAASRAVSSGGWSDDKILRASAWLKRHASDRDRMNNPSEWDKPPKYSPAYVAWLLWGDDGDNRGAKWIHAKADAIRIAQEENFNSDSNKDEKMKTPLYEGNWGMKFVALRHSLGHMLHHYIEKEITDDDVAAAYISGLGQAIDAAKEMPEHGDMGKASYYKLMSMIAEMLGEWRERDPYTAGGEMFYALKAIQDQFDHGPKYNDDDDDGDGSMDADVGYSDEAVTEPTEIERADLPSAAFEPAAFFDAEGEFVRTKSKLPHHINTATDPNDNETVDVPRLRNALARFSQTDFSEFGDGVKVEARAHLERHADALLYGAEEAECSTCKREQLDFLRVELGLFRLGLHEQHWKLYVETTDTK